MCEIAVVDPERTGIESIHQIAARFNEEQGDGLGILLVENNGDTFDYRVYKSIDPHWQTVFAFLKRNIDNAWRVIIHGRYSTSGRVRRKSAHPIRCDCDKCEFEYVVHNGSVRKYSNHQESLEEAGHSLNTDVDTEIIPHRVSELPDTIDNHKRNTYKFYGNLNYLLFSENGILVRMSNKYSMTDDFVLTCSRRDFDDPESHGFEYAKNEWALIEPDGDEPDIEMKEKSYNSTTTNSAYRTGGSSTSQNYSRSGSGLTNSRSSDDDTVMMKYDNISSWEGIKIIKVAPGVLRVMDEKGNSDFIRREKNPRAYHYYTDEPLPEGADSADDLPLTADGESQETLDQWTEESTETAVDEVMQVIQERVTTTRTIGEMADIQDELRQAIERGKAVAMEG